MVEDDDLETLSRRDVTWTPITGSDMILSWSVFPRDKPASTFPASAYAQKPNPYAFGEFLIAPSRHVTSLPTANTALCRGYKSFATADDGVERHLHEQDSDEEPNHRC